MQYQPYNSYTPSRFNEGASIPSGWNEKRLKFIASYNDEALPENTDPDCQIEYVDISSVNLIEGITQTEVLNFEKAPSRARRVVKDGDTIVSTVRTYLKAIAAIRNPPENMIVSTGFAVIRPKEEIDSHYLSYFLQSQGFVDSVVANSVGVSYPAINASVLACLPVYFPISLVEQQKIANFLDCKTQQIDQLIEKKKALIEKLNEQRIAIITQAVTKGLDKNAKMKPSGVDWLGDVPEHWEVKRLRFCITSNPTKSEIKDLNDDYLVSFVPMEAVNEYGGMDLSQTKLLEEVTGGYTYFKENDVVVAKITPCFENGKGSIAKGLVNGVGFGTTELHVLRGEEDMDEEYLFYLTISYPFRKNGEAIMVGAGGHKRISEDYIKNYRLGVPGIQEQKDIARHIDKELTQIDRMVDVSQQAIAKYEEYRASVITAAVTGKIDVRNVAI